MRNIGAPAFLFLGMTLLVWAAFAAAAHDGLPIRVENPVVNLGDVTPGRHYPATFSLYNSGKITVHVLGGSSQCSDTGCGDYPENLPLEIPPGETREVITQFHGANPGVIRYTFEIYTDAAGQTEIPVTIRGTTLPMATSPQPQAEARSIATGPASAPSDIEAK